MNRTAAPGADTATTRGDLWWYFAGAYAWTWALWIPAALAERGTLAVPVPVFLLQILGGLGPMGAAIAIAARRSGRTGVGDLFRQLRLRGLPRRWLVAAAAVGLLDVAPAVVYLANGGALPSGMAAQVLVMPLHFLFVATLGGGLDEEMGWRGFALPRLQAAWRPVPANLLLGIVWACWHLPFWLNPVSSHASTPFAVYLATVVAQSFVISWLYNASGGSLLVAVVAHSAADVFDGLRFAIIDDPGWALRSDLVQMVAMVVAAVALTFVTKGRLGAGPTPTPALRPADVAPAVPR